MADITQYGMDQMVTGAQYRYLDDDGGRHLLTIVEGVGDDLMVSYTLDGGEEIMHLDFATFGFTLLTLGASIVRPN